MSGILILGSVIEEEYMSKTPRVKTSPLNRRIGLFITIALVFAYFGGNFVLPRMIESAYQNKNCETVRNLGDIYSGMYPSMMTNKSIAVMVRECAVFMLAINKEEEKAWRDSYNAFIVYSETYPNGLFDVEAHEHSAVVLIGLAKGEVSQKKYSEAIADLNIVLIDFGDASAFADAVNLIPEVYKAWGADLRNTSDFDGAEKVLKEFQVWAQSNNRIDNVKHAQRELAQTYFAWGLALQAKRQFEDAKVKLDLVSSTDPEPLSSSGLASQVKENQIRFYGEWGDYLVEQKDFAGAIEKYKTAVSLAGISDKTNMEDDIANVYLVWANSLSISEDFLGALDQVALAAENSMSDTMKKSVDDAKLEINLAFSQSSGEQAQQSIKDVAEGICTSGKKPTLPIFGLDEDNILAVVYGIEEILPANVSAITPGAMHYVACIEDTVKSIQFFKFYRFLMDRKIYVWNVTLRLVETGEVIGRTSIEGGVPILVPIPDKMTQTWGKDNIDHNQIYQPFFGTRPNIIELANWLLRAMK